MRYTLQTGRGLWALLEAVRLGYFLGKAMARYFGEEGKVSFTWEKVVILQCKNTLLQVKIMHLKPHWSESTKLSELKST